MHLSLFFVFLYTVFCFAIFIHFFKHLCDKGDSFEIRIVTVASVGADAQLLEQRERVAVLLHLFWANGSGFGRSPESTSVGHGGGFV